MSKVMIQQRDPITLTCKRCGNEWQYKGHNPYVATCTFCKTTISVLKHRKASQAGQALERQASTANTVPLKPGGNNG